MAQRVLGLAVMLLLVGSCAREQPADAARPTNARTRSPGEAQRRLSPDLLEILADPGDKGPLTYIVDRDGNEWLVNPRNGYRYPVENGTPVMLLDEGAKHRDTNAINGSNQPP